MPTRRALLLGGLVASAALPLAACSGDGPPVPPQDCKSPAELTTFDALAGAPLTYIPSGSRQSFEADPKFVALLEDWAAEWVQQAGLGALVGIGTYGAYVDKCPSWHAAGRAFDFGELVHEGGTVSCRYDQWGDDPQRLRLYWRLAASLATRFTYTLGYPFNAQHHNHQHVDNGVSGYGATRYRDTSAAQTQLVQGVARFVFGTDCPQSGSFDDATRDAVRGIQRDRGIAQPLSSEDGWRAFLTSAAAA